MSGAAKHKEQAEGTRHEGERGQATSRGDQGSKDTTVGRRGIRFELATLLSQRITARNGGGCRALAGFGR